MSHDSTVMSRPHFGWGAMVVIGVGLFINGAASADVTPKQIDDAVDKGIAYLLSQQRPDGSWDLARRPNPPPKGPVLFGPNPSAIYGGETAIAAYALLAAGQNPQDAKIKKTIEWLLKFDLRGTYAVALRSQVWNLIPERLRTREILLARNRDRDFVLFSRIQRGAHAGMYGYVYGDDVVNSAGGMQPLNPNGPPDSAWYDRSNSQYGVLGAWALEQAGAEIPTKYWEEEDFAWKSAQFADGSWNYSDVQMLNDKGEHKKPTYTMTSAGLATLFITQDYLMRASGHIFDSCHGGLPSPAIDKGLAWMDRQIGNAIGRMDGAYFYGMYGIERIGVASGRKYFGNIDWYATAAEKIVLSQNASGAWGERLDETAFAILFLVRGRAPIMMNKLLYVNAPKKQTDPWNERPRDVANLAKWTGRRSLEGFLNWQIVNLQVPVEELHDAPIVYISGSEELSLSQQDIDKLRQFAEQGGMILGNADCGNKNFTNSFKKLGSKLFPKYEFRILPLSHPIFDTQFHAKTWKTKPVLEGLSNGVRELMVLIPQADPGKAWQTESLKTREESFQLGSNIFLYATGKENLRKKGETFIVHAKGEATRSIAVARLQAGDNPDPEPAGWPRLSAIMHNEHHIDLKPEFVKLGGGDLAKFKIAHFTGTSRFKLSDPQRKEVKAFVEAGGTLIVDSAGGSAEFADSAEAELKQIFGDAGAKGLAAPLAPTHALYSDPAWKTEPARYRIFTRQLLTAGVKEPRVRAIATTGGRLGVFYSREDLSAGLVGEQVDGILGYDPQTAVRLMSSMILYADGGGKIN